MGNVIVGSRGNSPNDIMLVGEAPGREEAAQGRPFVGKAGREQDAYLRRHGTSSRRWYCTNVVKEFIEGNPDPTPSQITRWSPVLEAEVAKVHPRLIIAVGRFAARWFLGDDTDMEAVHGVAQPPSARSGDAAVLPIYHPAAGFYDNDIRSLIEWDYSQVARAEKAARAGIELYTPPTLLPARYRDVSGRELAEILSKVRPSIPMTFDTEGTPSNPWSIQISTKEGEGFVLRTVREDFQLGAEAVERSFIDASPVVAHNLMYDLSMAKAMGIDLSQCELFDTMYAAYLLRIEPQSLKRLARRWLGVPMPDYSDLVAGSALDKQLDYLSRVVTQGDRWAIPEPRYVTKNDGTSRKHTPQGMKRRAEALLVDVYSKREVDIKQRWLDIDPDIRGEVESEFGPMPEGTIDDIPLDDAVLYSGRDADVTMRLYHILIAKLEDQDLMELARVGNGLLPVFEEMQSNGFPASRSYFERLRETVSGRMVDLQQEISSKFFSGRPFNPASHVQVATLMRRRGLQGSKRTKTGAVSTGKKSIEHLRTEDAAIEAVIDWRENQKIRDAFCTPLIAKLAGAVDDVAPIRCSIMPTRVHTRRLAAKDPNLLAIPVRHDLGKQVRDGFMCLPGEIFAGCDLSQVEMRYMAHLSQDPLLCKRFRDGRDVHAETAAEIFGIPLSQVDPMKHRYPAKRAGFGIITNIQGAGLYDQLRMFGCEGWDEESSANLIEQWLDVYKGVRRYLADCRKLVREKGYVRDQWGMIRYLPGVWSEDRKVAAEAERTASSHLIQAGAQGMIQNSMLWMKPKIRRLQLMGHSVHWVIQIHDEVILRLEEGLHDIVKALTLKALTQYHGVYKIRVPIEAEWKTATTWGGLK